MIRKLLRVLLTHGLGGALFRARVVVADWWFDRRYGVDTRGILSLDRLTIAGNNKNRGFRYEPARVAIVRNLFAQVRLHLRDPISMVDLGAGKGRIMLLAAESGFVRATGVEFAAELCSIAKANCDHFSRMTRTTTRFKVVESDVVNYDFADDDNLFVFFNPFDDVVMMKVLANIARSLGNRPRATMLAFYNTNTADLVARFPVISLVRDINCRGYRSSLYLCGQ